MNRATFLLAASSAILLMGCRKTADAPAQSSASQAQDETWTLVNAEPLEKLKVDRDDMRDLSFYRHPSGMMLGQSDAYLYIVVNKSKELSLRMNLTYLGEDWLFVRKAWTKLDGDAVDLTDVGNEWRRNNSSSWVWEVSDTYLEGVALKNIKRLANADSPTIRFEGRDFYQDFKPSQKRLQAMRAVIAAYEAAAGKEIK